MHGTLIDAIRHNTPIAYKLTANVRYPPVILQAHQRDAYYHALASRSSTDLAELFASAMDAYLSAQTTLRCSLVTIVMTFMSWRVSSIVTKVLSNLSWQTRLV